MDRKGTDRRANPRYPAVFDLQGTSDDGTVVVRMRASDLSLSGLRCTSTADFAEMTRLAVRLQLPLDGERRTEAVDVEAVVVRRREIESATNDGSRYELALFFTSIEDACKHRIARFLDR